MLNIISLGAGVQSSTMALMAAHGEITPMPDCAIFADTGAEPIAVYAWLDQLERLLPFPVHRVSGGNLAEAVGQKRKHGKYRKVKIPAYISDYNGPGGMISRSCTGDYKIGPITKRVREVAGLYRKRSPKEPVVIQWLGISTDEASRMKSSQEPWRANRFPLIELGMSRDGCLSWMEAHGYPKPPKSACVFCPYQSDARWKSLGSKDWDLAVAVDEKLRAHPQKEYCNDGKLYLHSSRIPIAEIRKFIGDSHGDLFDEECAGVCGV